MLVCPTMDAILFDGNIVIMRNVNSHYVLVQLTPWDVHFPPFPSYVSVRSKLVPQLKKKIQRLRHFRDKKIGSRFNVDLKSNFFKLVL